MKSLSRFYSSHPLVKYGTIFTVCFIVLFFRRPDAIMNAQFWAEDGKHWFGDAYTNGPLNSLFLAYAGSLQLAMRIAGSISQLLPFNYVPLFFTAIALLAKMLPVFLIHSNRFSEIFKNAQSKWLITIFYLAMANSSEIYLNLTNIGWHLALTSFLILIAPATKNTLLKIFDVMLLSVSVLTGPFSLLLVPTAFIIHLRDRSKVSLRNFIIVCSGFLIQLTYMLTTGIQERNVGLESINPNTAIFIQIIGKRIFAVTLFGDDIALTPYKTILILFLMTLCLVVLIYAFIKGSFPLRLFLGFTWATLAASLISPAMGGSWLVQLTAINDRYWFLPSLSFFVALVSLIKMKRSNRLSSFFSYGSIALILLIFFVSIPRSFRYKTLANQNFDYYSNEFRNLPSGQSICIPVNPDNGWLTCLKKQ